jgi:periplasmic divalent cation tolerance protein
VPENDKPLNAVNDASVLIYSTFPTTEAAETAGGRLVDQRLAACVNIIPGMTSIYVWQGERHRDAETVMIIKTRSELAEMVIREVRNTHSYSNPALLVLPVIGGSPDFISWILTETARPNDRA